MSINTPIVLQRALWINEIQRECLLEADGDIDAAMAAAELIISTQPAITPALSIKGIKEVPKVQLDSTLATVYPRNNAAQFLDKYTIAKAARDPQEHVKLKESIPQEHHYNLDTIISTLQSGIPIHHPKEPPGLAINLDGNISDPHWATYADLSAQHDEWEQRNNTRMERHKTAKELARAIRRTEVDHNDVDKLLKQSGATDSEIRSIVRMRHRVKKERKEIKDLEDLYEDIVEDIFFRIETEINKDIEPYLPPMPGEDSTSNIAFGMVDGEWRGRTPPGSSENWVASAPGPRGGKRWKPKNEKAINDANSAERSTADIGSAKGTGQGSIGRTGTGNDGQPAKPGTKVERKTPESSVTPIDTVGQGADTSNNTKTTGNTRTKYNPRKLTPEQQSKLNNVNKGIDSYARHFSKIGQEEVSDWFLSMKEHINKVGVDSALEMLGEDKSSTNPVSRGVDPNEKIQYKGTGYFGEDAEDFSFLENYLDENGIVLQTTDIPDRKLRVVSSAPVPSTIEQAKKGDIIARETNIIDKLQESKLLPGLESSEDIHKLIGHEVTQFTPDVLAKFDETYGKGKWIIKSYGDEAYAGFGVFFPQRIKNIQQESKKSLFDTNKKLKPKGYELYRDETGTVAGVKNSKTKEAFRFGSSEIRNLPDKKVKKLAAIAAASAPQENGTRLPLAPEDSLRQDYGILLDKSEDGKKVIGVTDEDGHYIKVGSEEWSTYGEYDTFGQVLERAITAVEAGEKGDNRFMIQPAFEAVGVSELDRALGATWETSTEGRVHVATNNGKASVIPYATLAGRSDAFPVVFANDDIRSMEKAVQDAIDGLPESERAGQSYAPDVMKTRQGWRVVELNASVTGGQSLWLEENPFVIDAYVSNVTGRQPAHAKFIRDLLTNTTNTLKSKSKTNKPDQSTTDTTDVNNPDFNSNIDRTESSRTNDPTKPNGPISQGNVPKGKSGSFSVDDQGLDHKGKGPGGGQFVAKGKGDDSSKDDKTKPSKESKSKTSKSTSESDSLIGLGVTAARLGVERKFKQLAKGIYDRLPTPVQTVVKARYKASALLWESSKQLVHDIARKSGVKVAKRKGIEDVDEYADKYAERVTNTIATIGVATSIGLGIAGLVATIGPGNIVAAAGFGYAAITGAIPSILAVPSVVKAGAIASSGVSAIGTGVVTGAKAVASVLPRPSVLLTVASLPVVPAAFVAYSTLRHPAATFNAAKEGLNNAIERVKDNLRTSISTSETEIDNQASLSTDNIDNIGNQEGINTLIRAYADHVDNPDWYFAQLTCALTKTHDFNDVITIANAMHEDNPTPPETTDKEEKVAHDDIMNAVENMDLPTEESDVDNSTPLSVDDKGLHHKGKGPGGGQFTSTGDSNKGGSKDTVKDKKGKDKEKGSLGSAVKGFVTGGVKGAIKGYKEGYSDKPLVATYEQHKIVIKKALFKFSIDPTPTDQEVAEAQEGIELLGANKYRRNLVGNTTDRRSRRNKLLKEFGDGETCPCIYCGLIVTHGTLEQDKMYTTEEGGRYRQSNVVPSCSDCNKRRGNMPFKEALDKVVKYAKQINVKS